MSKVRFALQALVASVALAGAASANTVSSNDPDCSGGATQRVFSVTATSVTKCLLKGVGNMNGNGDAVNALGYLTLDKSDTTGDLLEGVLTGTPSGLGSGTSGTFSIAASAYTNYTNLVILFKSGVAQADPDWAAFLLADNTTSGSWSITGANQALSHAILYGQRRDGGGGGGGNTPEPMSLALAAVALLGARAAVRRRT